jgi:Tfp pilus assembly protein PilN
MEEQKNKLVEGINPILLWGIIYIIILALLIWLIYAFRSVQIQQTNSKINSIQQAVTSQVGSDELAQLETITGSMATLYSHPFATAMLKDISGAIPKNTTLTNVSLSGSQISIQGTSASYDEVSLFAAAIDQQATTLQNAEIANASTSSSGQSGVTFTLQAQLK